MYILILLYCAVLLSGSLIGYLKAGSLASLIAGSVSLLFLILFTLLYRKGKRWAGYGLIFTTLLLDAFFTFKFIKTFAFFPAGLLTLLSTILLIVIALHLSKKLSK